MAASSLRRGPLGRRLGRGRPRKKQLKPRVLGTENSGEEAEGRDSTEHEALARRRPPSAAARPLTRAGSPRPRPRSRPPRSRCPAPAAASPPSAPSPPASTAAPAAFNAGPRRGPAATGWPRAAPPPRPGPPRQQRPRPPLGPPRASTAPGRGPAGGGASAGTGRSPGLSSRFPAPGTTCGAALSRGRAPRSSLGSPRQNSKRTPFTAGSGLVSLRGHGLEGSSARGKYPCSRSLAKVWGKGSVVLVSACSEEYFLTSNWSCRDFLRKG